MNFSSENWHSLSGTPHSLSAIKKGGVKFNFRGNELFIWKLALFIWNSTLFIGNKKGSVPKFNFRGNELFIWNLVLFIWNSTLSIGNRKGGVPKFNFRRNELFIWNLTLFIGNKKTYQLYFWVMIRFLCLSIRIYSCSECSSLFQHTPFLYLQAEVLFIKK